MDEDEAPPMERQGILFPAPPQASLPARFAAEAAVHLVSVPEFGSTLVESFGRERFGEYLARHTALLRDSDGTLDVYAFFGVRLYSPSVAEEVSAENPWED